MPTSLSFRCSTLRNNPFEPLGNELGTLSWTKAVWLPRWPVRRSTAAAGPPEAGDPFSVDETLAQTVEPHHDDDEPPPLVLASFEALPAVSAGEPDYGSADADYVVGASARFEANVVAVATLKMLEGSDRSPTVEERSLLARFSGFGDSTFEPAFRLSARRKDEQVWVERGHRLRNLVTEREWDRSSARA